MKTWSALHILSVLLCQAAAAPGSRAASPPRLICEPIICIVEPSAQGSERVCGSNGVAYDSQCAFENAKCEYPGLQLAPLASCSSVNAQDNKIKNKKSCELACEDNWYPICANNGVTYANACRLEEAYCRDHSIGPLHYGECKEA